MAIHNVTCNTVEWYTEQAYRYYSKTYHTPLHIAKQVLNPAEVIRVQMEDEMADMPPEDITSLKDRLAPKNQPMLSAEDYSPVEDESMSDEEWVMQQMAAAAKQEKDAEKPKVSGPSMADASKMAQQAIQNLYTKLDKPIPEQLEGDIKFDKKE